MSCIAQNHTRYYIGHNEMVTRLLMVLANLLVVYSDAEMQSHNQQLKMEIESLKQQIQHFGRIQELTEMLQESHRYSFITSFSSRCYP